MKKYLIIPIALLFSSGIFAQGIYNNGVKIVIGAGVTFNLGGTGGNYQNETNVTSGSIDLAGTLKISGNITNNVVGADIFSTTAPGSEVILSSTTPQSLGGSTTATFTFANLTIDNSVGILVSKNILVNGNLTLTNGLLDIGNNNFTFGPSAFVLGTPSSTNMIVATGSSQVQKLWSGIGTFTFPIGNYNFLSKYYSPVTLTFTSGTFAPGSITGVNVVNAKYNDPTISGSYLNRYWNITQTGITGFTCDAVYQYPMTDVVGTESNISSLKVLPTPITAFSATNATLHQLTTTGLTSLGTFTGGPGNYALSLAVLLEGAYNGTGGMNTTLNTTPQRIPLTQPYTNVAPWNYTGSESVAAIPSGVVDWVLVEVRQATTPALATSGTILTKRAGLLLSNGSIVDIDGVSPLNIGRPAITSNLYVVVRHRNHLAIMSATSPTVTSTTYSYDFTTSLAQAYLGGTGYKQLSAVPLKFGMVVGDPNSDGSVTILDYNQWAINYQKINGYYNPDLNFDGSINVLDYNKWALNYNAVNNINLKSASIIPVHTSAVPN